MIRLPETRSAIAPRPGSSIVALSYVYWRTFYGATFANFRIQIMPAALIYIYGHCLSTMGGAVNDFSGRVAYLYLAHRFRWLHVRAASRQTVRFCQQRATVSVSPEAMLLPDECAELLHRGYSLTGKVTMNLFHDGGFLSSMSLHVGRWLPTSVNGAGSGRI